MCCVNPQHCCAVACDASKRTVVNREPITSLLAAHQTLQGFGSPPHAYNPTRMPAQTPTPTTKSSQSK